MRLIVILLFLLPITVFGHEIQSITQHVDISNSTEAGWQQDLIARAVVDRKLSVGAQGTYLERFNQYEKRAGGFVTYRPNMKWDLEARYLQGSDNDILPEKQIILSAYYAAAPGFSPYIFYRSTQYSFTNVNSATLGIEIEKIPTFIIIPTVMFGKATFESPGDTRDVYNFGLRIIRYIEKKYAFSVFGYKGTEASQAVVGRSTELVDTLTGGLGAAYYFMENFRTELLVDHSDYDELDTRFLTTTLNLSWTFQ